MSTLSIIKYPHPILKKVANPIEKVDDSIRELATNMFETMYVHNGVGLAAPQVGSSIKLSVLNINTQDENKKPNELVLINPEIIHSEGEMIEEEGCLSFPGIFAKIKRFSKVKVRAYDLDEREFTIEADGLLSKVLQHEVDHLNGILILLKMSTQDKIINKKLLKELENNFKKERKKIK